VFDKSTGVTYFCIKPWCLVHIADRPSGFEQHLSVQQQLREGRNAEKLVKVMTADTNYNNV
jgi:hypothetical protein